MSGYQTDIRKISVILNGTFGNISLRNWGENGTSINVESVDPDLYKEKIGANGDTVVSKSYKPKVKMVRINVLPKSADYITLQQIVALEESGTSNVFEATVKDDNTGEQYTSVSAVLKNAPNVEFGDDIAGDIEYQIMLLDTIHLVP